MKILVTGGAGYIGSHIVTALGEEGSEVLVYDNLSTGHRNSLLCGDLVVGDLHDRPLLEQTLRAFRPDAVMHFAAFLQVNESVREPLKYYRNNIAGTISLLDAMKAAGVMHLIYSSTAAVYGNPERVPITENEPANPVNPYGQSKSAVERIMNDLSAAEDFRFVSLRYFNAAGADEHERIGERHDPETHLIPLVLKTAKGERDHIDIYGTDYPTPDGTCVRDFIHVADLAEAHILAQKYLLDGGESDIFNCGYGRGFSVREVIQAARTVTGKDFNIREIGRREGDPPVLVADCSKIKNVLHWKPRYDDLHFIIKSAWEWEKRL